MLGTKLSMVANGKPGEFNQEIQYLTYLLDDLTLDTEQALSLEQNHSEMSPVILSHPNSETLFTSQKIQQMVHIENGEVYVKLHLPLNKAIATIQEWNAALLEAIKVVGHPEQSLVAIRDFTVVNLAEIMEAFQFELDSLIHENQGKII